MSISEYTALRCFFQTEVVLSGQGKGALKEAFQVIEQELNESEPLMRCRNDMDSVRNRSYLVDFGKERGSNLKRLAALALGI